MTRIIVLVKQEKLEEDDKQLIRSVLDVANIKDYEVVNLKYYRIPQDKDIKFITFGPVGDIPVEKKICALPHVNQLFYGPNGENEQYRERAYTLLKALASQQEVAKIVEPINAVDLPDFTEEQLLSLEKALSSKGIKAFTGLNKQGKSIRIRLDATDTEEADIVINLHELLAIKLAVNLLDMKEVHIVRSNREDNSNNSSK